MLKINFIIIFFLFLFVIIDGTDEDLIDDLWKNLKSPTPKNFKNQKFGENNTIKQEIVEKNDEQENANKIEMEDIKPIKIKEPKIELGQLNEESFGNQFDQQADQNVSFADLSNSANDKDYNNMNTEEINEIEILNKFNLMKKELRKENAYKNLTNAQFECEIAKKLGTNRNKISKLKKKLGQKRERTEESEETKMELIRKFDQLRKEKICGYKYVEKKRSVIEREIAKELGTNRNKIYKLKKKLGQKRVKTEESEETKMELIRKFDKMRKEKICGLKYDRLKRNKIEHEIANELGVTFNKFYQWKRELGIIKKFLFTNEEKMEKLEQFERIKEEFKKKFNFEPNRKIESKIAEKIGIVWNTIYKWKRKFGLITRERKIYSVNEKLEYVKKSEEMAERNLTICEKKIAETLGIPNDNLRRWTRKFGTKPIPERKRYSDAEKLDYVKRSEEMRKRNSMISERKIAEKFGINRKNLRQWTEKFGTKSL